MQHIRQAAIIFIISFLFLFSFVQADQAQDIYTSKSLLIKHQISGSVSVLPSAEDLSELFVNLTFTPTEDYRQEVISEYVVPFPKNRHEDYVVFEWQPASTQNDYFFDMEVLTKNTYKPIRTSVSYPLDQSTLPEETLEYLKPTNNVDITPQISKQALDIASDTEDLFQIAHDLAVWTTTHISYNLTTLTQNASQKASWVLANRNGVCDELSTLYISFMRSLGVPARFVSGVSYSNSELFAEPWNAHAWVEVYFPEYGWVPFDLTFQQFGYIDASHLKLKTSVDGDDSTTFFSWRGYNLDEITVTPSALKMETTIIESYDIIEEFVVANASFLDDTIAIGSSTLYAVTLQNTKPHYVSANLQIAAPADVELNRDRQYVLLEPLETKTIYIPLTVKETLASGYKYTFPVKVYNLYNPLTEDVFYAQEGETQYSLNEINQIVQVKSQVSLLADKMFCSLNTTDVVVDEEVLVTCSLEFSEQTKGTLCVNGTCDSLTTQLEQEYSFPFTFTDVKLYRVPIILTTDQQKATLFDIHVRDRPTAQVANISITPEIELGEFVELTFLIERTSYANPLNAHVQVGSFEEAQWELGPLATNKGLTLYLYADDLAVGKNDIEIVLTYEDLLGNSYSHTQTATVDLINVNFFERMLLAIRHFFA